jgi:tetratricopeptide (TPR) repeat protein
MKTFSLITCLFVAVAVCAAVDVEPIEKLIADGKPKEALAMLDKALASKPNNPKLLYNYGVANYAAGNYDEALLAFDKVEMLGRGGIVEKARAQKGNAEFHLGLQARNNNLDETIERWKTSLDHYNGALKQSPADAMAKSNHDTVQKLLMDILLKQAQTKLEAGLKDNWAERKIEELREAMEKFQEARQVDPQSKPAEQGEKKAREELAKVLAQQGEKKATPKPEQQLTQQVPEIQKGVDMLEDANQLVPEDKEIKEKLDKAKETLAKALVEKAKQEIARADMSQWDREKFEQLDKAINDAQEAQELSPKNEEAPKVEQQAKDALAQLHEEKADDLAQQAEHMNNDYKVQRLESALDHYEAAEELKPDDKNLQAKAEQTEEKLAEALEKLADKLLEEPRRPEQLDAKVARFEQADSTLQNLEELKPTQKTEQKLDMVEQKLAELRKQQAEQEKQELAKQQQQQKPNQQQAKNQLQEQDLEMQEPPPMKQPEQKGQFKSDAMDKKTKDY